MRAVDIAHAALCEAGRRDLADEILWFEDDGGYLEVDSEILTEDEWQLVNRAESLARASLSLPPIERATR